MLNYKSYCLSHAHHILFNSMAGFVDFCPIISSNLASIQSINWLSCKIFCAQSSSKSNGVAYFLLSLRESQQELRRQPVPLSGTVPSSSRLPPCLSIWLSISAVARRDQLQHQHQQEQQRANILWSLQSLPTLTHGPRATSHDSAIAGAIQLSCPGGGWKDSGTKLSFCFWATNSANWQHVCGYSCYQKYKHTDTHTPTHTCAACSQVLR